MLQDGQRGTVWNGSGEEQEGQILVDLVEVVFVDEGVEVADGVEWSERVREGVIIRKGIVVGLSFQAVTID